MITVRLDRINELMEDGNWTVTELAEAAGVNYQYVYRLLRGDWTDVGSTNLASLARALGTSTDYLLGLTDNPKPPQPAAGLSLAESRLVYEVTGSDDDVRRLLGLFEALSPEQREIVRRVAEEMVGAGAARVVE